MLVITENLDKLENINIYKFRLTKNIMSILSESKERFNQARARIEGQIKQRQQQCIEAGTHDTSKGNLSYIVGRVNSVIVLQGCNVGIEIIGECPNCHTHYRRQPTQAEMQTPEYKQMLSQLETPDSVYKKLNRPTR